MAKQPKRVMVDSQRVMADSLKKGEIVLVFRPPSIAKGKQMPGEYLVEDANHSSASPGMGGMSEGSPETWTVELRRLNADDSYNPKNKVLRTSFSTWHSDQYIYQFEKTSKRMKQQWIPV